MKLTIAENFRALFYSPFYAIGALGHAAREGFEIDWVPSGVPGGAIDDVKRGRIDAMFGGPMRVLKDHDTTPADGASLVCFAEVVARDPFYLVANASPAHFRLQELAGMRVGIVSEVPTPWYCLRADLEEAGVDTAAMRKAGRFVDTLTMAQQLEALDAGRIDVAQVFEPLVEGRKILYAAATRGPCIYTTFMCSRDNVSRLRAEFAALTRATQATLDWVAAHSADGLARAVAPFFPDLPAERLRSGLARYHAMGLWSRSATLSEPGFERLAYSLHSGGFVKRRASYAECVHDFGRTA